MISPKINSYAGVEFLSQNGKVYFLNQLDVGWVGRTVWVGEGGYGLVTVGYIEWIGIVR